MNQNSPRSKATCTLKEWIASGKLEPGQVLPPERKLCKMVGVSFATLQRSVRMLEEENIIIRKSPRIRIVNPETQTGAESLFSKTLVLLSQRSGYEPETGFVGAMLGINKTIQDTCEREGYHLLLVNPPAAGTGELNSLLHVPPAGVICTSEHAKNPNAIHVLKKLYDSGVPVVTFSDKPTQGDFHSVSSDQFKGGQQIAHGLRKKNCRNLLVLAPRQSGDWFKQRLDGIRDTISSAKHIRLKVEEISPPDSAPQTQKIFKRSANYYTGVLAPYILGDSPPDAIIIPSDGIIFAVASALRVLKVVPNKDIFLSGYDNYWAYSPERSYESSVPLITIDKNNEAIGEELFRIVKEQKRSTKPDSPTISIIDPKPIFPLGTGNE